MSLRGWDVTRRASFVLILLASACADTPPAAPLPAGEMTATFSGAIAERYEARGIYPGLGRGEPATFAAARRGTAAGVISIGGWRARAPDIQDALLLDLRDFDGARTYALSDGTMIHGQTRTSPGVWFRITSGEVTIESVAGGRIDGRFSAIAVESVPPIGGVVPDTVRISAGTFSVPIVVP